MERFVEYLSVLKSSTYEHLSGEHKASIKEKHGKNKFMSQSRDALDYLDSSRVPQGQLISRVVYGLLWASEGDGSAVVGRLLPFV